MRTRHGSSDYIRGRHQQQFIAATINAVDKSELSGLVDIAIEAAKGKWVTNFPTTLGAATELYDALQGATLTNSVVFKPCLRDADPGPERNRAERCCRPCMVQRVHGLTQFALCRLGDADLSAVPSYG